MKWINNHQSITKALQKAIFKSCLLAFNLFPLRSEYFNIPSRTSLRHRLECLQKVDPKNYESCRLCSKTDKVLQFDLQERNGFRCMLRCEKLNAHTISSRSVKVRETRFPVGRDLTLKEFGKWLLSRLKTWWPNIQILLKDCTILPHHPSVSVLLDPGCYLS